MVGTYAAGNAAMNGLGDDTKTVKQTFYGTKASSNPNNPCKGATTRVCGILEQTYNKLSLGNAPMTIVKETIKDADGNVIKDTQKIENRTVNELKSEFINSGIRKGAVIVTDTTDE